jgi:hypothetical protein
MDRARNKLTRQNFGDVSSRVSIVSLAVSLCVGVWVSCNRCLYVSLWCL